MSNFKKIKAMNRELRQLEKLIGEDFVSDQEVATLHELANFALYYGNHTAPEIAAEYKLKKK